MINFREGLFTFACTSDKIMTGEVVILLPGSHCSLKNNDRGSFFYGGHLISLHRSMVYCSMKIIAISLSAEMLS